MAITTDESASTATAIVTVRVPRSGDTDLTTDAEQRLARIDGVESATVDELRGIEPQLSATAVAVEATLRSTESIRTLPDRLSDATAVESFQGFESG